MDSWQSGVVTWDQRNSETTNLHDSVAMLEHEPLTAATIVTGTTGYLSSCRRCFKFKFEGRIKEMRPALMATRRLPLVVRMANTARFVTVTAVTYGFGARNRENFNLEKV